MKREVVGLSTLKQALMGGNPCFHLELQSFSSLSIKLFSAFVIIIFVLKQLIFDTKLHYFICLSSLFLF